MNNGGENAATPQFTTTKVSIVIVSLTGIVTFLGMLPKLTSLFALVPSSFSLPFPKIWILLTATFYHENILFGLFNILIFLLFARQIEPLMGSKEFLRLFITLGFYTNILVLLFAAIMILITGNRLILQRPFITSGAPLSAMVIWLAHEFVDMKIPTMCGLAEVRAIPFYSFFVQLLFSLLGSIDGLITTIFSYVLTYLYIRYIKRNGLIRGDPSFSPLKLLPSCCTCFGDDDDDNDGPAVPPMGFGTFQQPGDANDGGGIDRFRYNNNNNDNQGQRNNNNQNRQTPNRFQGSPRTVGN